MNVHDLESELINLFNDIKNDVISPKKAAEMNNSAGKIINLQKIKLEYASLRKEKPEIPFLSSVVK